MRSNAFPSCFCWEVNAVLFNCLTNSKYERKIQMAKNCPAQLFFIRRKLHKITFTMRKTARACRQKLRDSPCFLIQCRMCVLMFICVSEGWMVRQRRRSRWIMKKLWERPFKKELEVDGTQVNIKEGENTKRKTLRRNARTFGFFFWFLVLNLWCLNVFVYGVTAP